MPSYEYRCVSCDVTFTSQWRDDEMVCIRCTRMARRVWGFTPLPSFPGNPHVHADNLARASDEASKPRVLWDAHGEAHTIEPAPARYVPVDLRDRERLGVTSEGLDATYDHLRAIGNDPAADQLRKVLE